MESGENHPNDACSDVAERLGVAMMELINRSRITVLAMIVGNNRPSIARTTVAIRKRRLHERGRLTFE